MPVEYPGCSGTRKLSDNLSDLKAQIAANQRGIALVTDLMDEMGVDVVKAYMQHIQENAEHAVREMLKKAGAKAIEETGEAVLRCTDYLDDGSPIALRVDIDVKKGTAHFDFTGTGPQVRVGWAEGREKARDERRGDRAGWAGFIGRAFESLFCCTSSSASLYLSPSLSVSRSTAASTRPGLSRTVASSTACGAWLAPTFP